MGPAEQSYNRLPGKGAGSSVVWATGFRLWLGQDHLLSVADQRYSQEYKRFYFRNIQAIALHRTFKWHTITIVSTLFSLIFFSGTLAVWFSEGPGLSLFCLVPALIFLAGLIGNLIRGPTCATYLRTAVQTERLYSLRRVRTAMKVIRILRPLIENIQGALTPEEAERQQNALVIENSREPSQLRHPSAPPMRLYQSRAHQVLFSLLFVDLFHSGIQFFFTSMTILLLGILLTMGILITLIVAMIKQSNTDLIPSVKTLTWCTLAYLILSYLWGTGYNIALSIVHPALANNPLALLRVAADTSPSESIGVLLMLVFSIGCSAVIGTFGFIYLNEFRKTRRTPPPLPEVQPETENRDQKTDDH